LCAAGREGLFEFLGGIGDGGLHLIAPVGRIADGVDAHIGQFAEARLGVQVFDHRADLVERQGLLAVGLLDHGGQGLDLRPAGRQGVVGGQESGDAFDFLLAVGQGLFLEGVRQVPEFGVGLDQVHVGRQDGEVLDHVGQRILEAGR